MSIIRLYAQCLWNDIFLVNITKKLNNAMHEKRVWKVLIIFCAPVARVYVRIQKNYKHCCEADKIIGKKCDATCF